MSKPNLPKPADAGKPEAPPIIATLRLVQRACAEHDRVMTENVAALVRTLEGRG